MEFSIFARTSKILLVLSLGLTALQIIKYLTNYLIMTTRHIFVGFYLLPVITAAAQGGSDNVHILDCKDTYVFREGNNGGMEITNAMEVQYGVTQYGALVQPSVFYGDFIRLDKASSKGKALYKSATPRNTFFDDTKVCYFNYQIPKVGKTLKASFERTFTNPVYFTTIPLCEDNYVENKTVQVVIPKAFAQYHLKECNFPEGIVKTATANEAGDSVFTYTIHGLPAFSADSGAPAWDYTAPHLLVLGSFKDIQDMFAWSRQLADVDCTIPNQAEILAEIGKGAKSDYEKIANTYAWVQQNIRYLAYEAGISAHQPATPAETLRKRYGDCKAMALLLKTLLKVQGFDARQTDIGTDDIPYSPEEVPTIASIDHAICTVFHDGKTLYLDATNPYTPLGYVPVNIQGRQALVEEGTGCKVYTLPILPAATCSSMAAYDGVLSAMEDGNYAMRGKVRSSWLGDLKAMLLSSYDAATQDDKPQVLAHMLGANKGQDKLSDIQMTGNRPQDDSLAISASFYKDNVGLSVDGKVYIDMNPDADLLLARVDTAGRTSDYMLDLVAQVVREVKLSLPPTMRLQELPAPYEANTPWVSLRRTFSRQGDGIVMRKECIVKDRRIAFKDLTRWNQLVSEWKDACNEQVVILTKQ